MMKVSIVIFAFLTVALGLALEAADAADTTGAFNDPMSYCKAVGAIDAPDAKYKGPAVPDWMVAALYTPQEIKAQKSSGVDPKRAVVWRCMSGGVWACVQGNSPICGKANRATLQPRRCASSVPVSRTRK